MSATFPDTVPAVDDAELLGVPACTGVPVGASTADVDITFDFSVPAGHSNFGSSVIANYPGTVVADAAITNGSKVGALASTVTLGLLNGACATTKTVEFVLFDSTTSGSLTVNAEGTENRWSSDNGPNGIVTDVNGDDIADSTSPFVGGNPSIYNDLFTTDSSSTLVTPKARYTGATVVEGDWQLLSFFQLDPSTLSAFATDANDKPHIFGRVSHTPTTGTLNVSILNDPTAKQISISPIHDFCSPLAVKTMLLGRTPGGELRYTTPAAGSYGMSGYSYGLRDDDNDGLENAYDTCPFVANTGDSESPVPDGLNDPCDPTPSTNTGLGDHDSDGFFNKQDNCPIDDNGPLASSPNDIQTDAEVDEPYKDAAPDGGPKTDSIGEQCDPNDLTSHNEGAFVEAFTFTPKCVGAGPDADSDGFCSAQDANDGDLSVRGFTLNTGMDQEYYLATHGDGYGNNYENYYGTSPIKKCPVNTGGNNEAVDAWPPDFDDTALVDVSDVLTLKPVFFVSVTTNALARFDLVPDKLIDVTDVLSLKPLFFVSCTPQP
jgi:hypothetical protein